MIGSKPPFAGGAGNHAKRTPLHFALRGTLVLAARHRFWIVIGAAIALSAVAGPFNSLDRADFAGRVMYWGAIAVLSGLCMTFLSVFMRLWLTPGGDRWVFPSVLAGVIGTVPVTLMTLGVETAIMPADGSFGLRQVYLYVSPVVVVLTLAVNFFVTAEIIAEATGQAPCPDEAPTEPVSPSLVFDKLPAELGRDIVCMQAQDHYVEVTTTLGAATILMRLSDAEHDLNAQGGFRGMRPHRSWWINLDHAVSLLRTETGGMEVQTTRDTRVPVARAQRSALQQAMGLA